MLVADEFRMEQSGKILAIGLYSDSVVVLTIPKNAPKATKETPYSFDGVSLLLTVGGFTGTENVRFGLKGGKLLEHPVLLGQGMSANLVLNVKPFRVASFGQKTVVVEFAGTTHELPFELRANYIDPVADIDQYVEVVREQPKLPSPTTGTGKPKVAKKKAPARSSAK